jgi:hypothetical protein
VLTVAWTTTTLNLWSSATDSGEPAGELAAGAEVAITGRQRADRVELVIDGLRRWVTAGYLGEHPPGVADGTCDNGTSVPAAVSPNIVAVHRAVCAAYPAISVYGTLRGGGGDHPLGRAVDIMVSGPTGWAVANFVRARASELGVTYVIFAQSIWSSERAAEGWRAMADRGSVTANHYDHVHVSTR